MVGIEAYLNKQSAPPLGAAFRAFRGAARRGAATFSSRLSRLMGEGAEAATKKVTPRVRVISKAAPTSPAPTTAAGAGRPPRTPATPPSASATGPKPPAPGGVSRREVLGLRPAGPRASAPDPAILNPKPYGPKNAGPVYRARRAVNQAGDEAIAGARDAGTRGAAKIKQVAGDVRVGAQASPSFSAPPRQSLGGVPFNPGMTSAGPLPSVAPGAVNQFRGPGGQTLHSAQAALQASSKATAPLSSSVAGAASSAVAGASNAAAQAAQAVGTGAKNVAARGAQAVATGTKNVATGTKNVVTGGAAKVKNVASKGADKMRGTVNGEIIGIDKTIEATAYPLGTRRAQNIDDALEALYSDGVQAHAMAAGYSTPMGMQSQMARGLQIPENFVAHNTDLARVAEHLTASRIASGQALTEREIVGIWGEASQLLGRKRGAREAIESFWPGGRPLRANRKAFSAPGGISPVMADAAQGGAQAGAQAAAQGAQGGAGGAAGGVAQWVQNNPWPALIGAGGAGALMFGGRGGSTVTVAE